MCCLSTSCQKDHTYYLSEIRISWYWLLDLCEGAEAAHRCTKTCTLWAYVFTANICLKCHMAVEGGGYWLCVHTCPISTQSVWQASVTITTPPRVAFLSHQPVLSSLLSVGAVFGHSTEGQQTTTMYTVVQTRVTNHLFIVCSQNCIV